MEIPDYDLLIACHYDIMRVKMEDKQALIEVNGTILEDFTDDLRGFSILIGPLLMILRIKNKSLKREKGIEDY